MAKKTKHKKHNSFAHFIRVASAPIFWLFYTMAVIANGAGIVTDSDRFDSDSIPTLVAGIALVLGLVILGFIVYIAYYLLT